MSKHNRDWLCVGCGRTMRGSVCQEAEATAAGLSQTQSTPVLIVHHCGTCDTFQVFDRGEIRALTTAELFDLHIRHAKVMDAVKALDQVDPRTLSPAVMIVGIEERTP